MKKRLILLISLFFSTLAFSMEERADGSKIENLQNLQTNQVDTNQTFDTNQSFFESLPDEIIEYIFSLLVEEAYTKGSTAFEKLIAILSNTANIKCVNNRWNTITSGEEITKRITNLTKNLVQNNKEDFEDKLFGICKIPVKKINFLFIGYDYSINTTPSLENLCLVKAIAIAKQRYSQGLKTNLNSLPIELKKKIIQHIQPLKNLKCLLIAGVDLNARDTDGSTALLNAILLENNETIALMLNHIKKLDVNIQLDIINTKDSFSNTALMMAIDNEKKETIELILNHIKNLDVDSQLKIINTKNDNDNTALMAVSTFNRIEIAELILNHIKNLDIDSQLRIINTKNDYGNTALMIACNFNRIEIVELILNHIKTFDINSQLEIINTKNNNGNAALSGVAFFNNKKAAVLILNHIKDFDIATQLAIINAKNTVGETALDMANLNSSVEIIKLLEDALNKLNRGK